MPRKRIYFTDEQRREGKRLSAKKCYDADPERARAIRRDWYHRNKDRLRPAWNLRDKRKSRAEGTYAPADVDNIYQLQRGRCAICRTSLGKSFHRDHIIPLALGGTNWPSNIQLLCPPCNMSKGAKDPLDHMRALGKLL